METEFNVLVTSISKKIPLLDVVRHSLKSMHFSGRLYGADANPLCIGRYFVDEFWQMPDLEHLTLDLLVEYCKKQKIKAIFPTRDGELPFFAAYRDVLEKSGIFCMISSPKTIEVCADKQLFYDFLTSLNIPAILTDREIPLSSNGLYVVKERFGAGSQSIGLKLSGDQAKIWAKKLNHPVFQPFIEGKEYSVDVYIDRQKKAHGAVARIRELVVGGESQITSSIKHKKIESLCLKAAVSLGIYGHAVLQVIEDSSKNIHLIECNARFGGASTLSVAMGLHSFQWFLQESLGEALEPFKRSDQELRQIRYPKDKLLAL